jgi:hypothetical protein
MEEMRKTCENPDSKGRLKRTNWREGERER